MYIVGGKSVKTAGMVSVVYESLHHPRDQRAGFEEKFFFRRFAFGKRHPILFVPFAAEAYHTVAGFCGDGDDVKVDRSRQYAAVIVVGVVA